MRKNLGSLTKQERERFVATVLALKRKLSVLRPSDPESNRYDDFVRVHLEVMPVVPVDYPMTAHMCAGFLPWHRALLLVFEQELQVIDPSVTIPYWDSCDPAYHGKDSVIWGEDFLGGDGTKGGETDGKVMTGAFAFDRGQWPIRVRGEGEPEFLVRQLGQGLDARTGRPEELLQKNAEMITLSRPLYDVDPWMDHDWVRLSPATRRNRLEQSFRLSVEMVQHNLVHRWVGGHMVTSGSPNDPVFWLHHCNIDRLWAHWQVQHPAASSYAPLEHQELGLWTPLVFNPAGGAAPWLNRYRPIDLLDPDRDLYVYESMVRPVLVPTLLELREVPRRRVSVPFESLPEFMNLIRRIRKESVRRGTSGKPTVERGSQGTPESRTRSPRTKRRRASHRK